MTWRVNLSINWLSHTFVLTHIFPFISYRSLCWRIVSTLSSYTSRSHSRRRNHTRRPTTRNLRSYRNWTKRSVVCQKSTWIPSHILCITWNGSLNWVTKTICLPVIWGSFLGQHYSERGLDSLSVLLLNTKNTI